MEDTDVNHTFHQKNFLEMYMCPENPRPPILLSHFWSDHGNRTTRGSHTR